MSNVENTGNSASVAWFLDSTGDGDAAAPIVAALRGVQRATRSQSFALLMGKLPPLAHSLLAPLEPQLGAELSAFPQFHLELAIVVPWNLSF